MPDPLQSLKNLDPGEHVTPLPASEIRRRGDAMRRRRVTTIAVGASLAAALVAVPIALMSTDRGTPVEPATSDTSTTTDAPTDPATDDPTAVTTEIPDDFPLAIGTVDRDVLSTHGPAPRGETGADVLPIEPCGVPIWPAGGVETLDLFVESPGWWDGRELATYGSEQEAAAVLEAAREALDGCTSYPGGDEQALQVLDGDAGDDTVTFGYALASGAPGGTVVQMMQVGSAVLVSSGSGELTVDTLQLTADDLTLADQEIATHMCVFSAEGC